MQVFKSGQYILSILIYVTKHPGCTRSEIERETGLTYTKVTRSINTLKSVQVIDSKYKPSNLNTGPASIESFYSIFKMK